MINKIWVACILMYHPRWIHIQVYKHPTTYRSWDMNSDIKRNQSMTYFCMDHSCWCTTQDAPTYRLNILYIFSPKGGGVHPLCPLILSLVKVQVAMPIAECKIFLINIFLYTQNCLMMLVIFYTILSFLLVFVNWQKYPVSARSLD